MPNALARESSPYLRQHADNPVDWHPWGEEAFALARSRNVPVLISIGYSTCHWCHVMAHECFEDPATAAVMNEHLVCIKVDREEHPEVDAIYMDAVQALSGHGGWPLNAFADHHGKPFYACTYLPSDHWLRLVDHLSTLWRSDRERVARAAHDILAHISEPSASHGMIRDTVWAALDKHLERSFDHRNPGYGWSAEKAPKFPPSQLLALLLASGRKPLVAQAEQVLEAMQDAGLHDRVGGGFHRYSVDAQWRVPHFEKMLYDNAQLIVVYCRAGIQLGRPDFLQTAINAGDYLLRDLRVVDGTAFLGYASAEDADDPGGEGSFYAWSPEQLNAVLGESEGAQLAREWDLQQGAPHRGRSGHFEPVASHIPQPRAGQFARMSETERQAARRRWEPLYPRLRAVRDARPRPGRDDKVLTDQNALALEAFAALGRYTGLTRFSDACRELAGVLATRMTPEGLLRLPQRPGFITDYGSSVAALTAAFDLLGDPALITLAERIADEAITRLRADDGGFYTTPAGRTDLVRRSREPTDNAWPSGQNALTLGLVRLWNLTGVGRWWTAAEGVFANAASICEQQPSSVATLLLAWRNARRGHGAAVIRGDLADPLTQALLAQARLCTDPAFTVLSVEQCRGQNWHVLEGRREASRPEALVCLDRSCLAPAHNPEQVAQRLSQAAR